MSSASTKLTLDRALAGGLLINPILYPQVILGGFRGSLGRPWRSVLSDEPLNATVPCPDDAICKAATGGQTAATVRGDSED